MKFAVLIVEKNQNNDIDVLFTKLGNQNIIEDDNHLKCLLIN